MALSLAVRWHAPAIPGPAIVLPFDDAEATADILALMAAAGLPLQGELGHACPDPACSAWCTNPRCPDAGYCYHCLPF